MDSLAARAGILSRAPEGIKAIRSLRDETGLEAEVVLLDAERAIVVAALSELTLQPRPLSSAERCMVQDPHHLSAATEASFTRRIPLGQDELLVFSVHEAVTEKEMERISAVSDALADALEHSTSGTAASGELDLVAILETQRDVLLVVDHDFFVTYCNQAVITTFGWTPQELVGRSATDLVHPDDIDIAISSVARLQKAEEIYRVRLRFANASGGWTPVSITGIDQSVNPGIRGVTISIRPAEYEYENNRALRVLETRANTDQLTGLANRQSLHDSLLAFASKHAADDQQPARVGAYFIGIDNFNAINDIHGHGIGDQVLRVAAARLRGISARVDLLARMGGDEFIVVQIEHQRGAGESRFADHLRLVLGEPYEIAGNRLHLTVSVGVALQDTSEFTADVLLHNASIALVAAKERGRDQIAEFDVDLANAGALAQTQRTNVRDALAQGRMEMHYQPIVDLNGRILGFEALARCFDSEGTLHMPSNFMPAIGGTSLLVDLDRTGFEQACALAVALDEAWPNENHFVSSNFSANSLSQSDFVEHVLTTIMRTGARPSSLAIEITESAAFEAGPPSINALSELREAQVGIALDDFGTGYSSLSHLRDLPLSAVKIDQSFVAALPVPGPEQTITRAITELARALGFIIIAEGIETPAQLNAASLIGIDRLQGWHFDKALTLEEAHNRLRSQHTDPSP